MDKPENSTLLNVCIFPNDRVSAECVGISQSFEDKDTMFVLGNGLFPHMTAYMARFANNDIERVVAATEDVIKQTSAFRCIHTGYFMTEGRYLEASYRKSSEFMDLHELLIANLAGLRINPGLPFIEGYFAPYNAEQQQNAKDTGYDLARNLYRPHVTLTRYIENGVPKIFPAMPAADLSFNLYKVCVYKADDNGAVCELVRELYIS